MNAFCGLWALSGVRTPDKINSTILLAIISPSLVNSFLYLITTKKINHNLYHNSAIFCITSIEALVFLYLSSWIATPLSVNSKLAPLSS